MHSLARCSKMGWRLQHLGGILHISTSTLHLHYTIVHLLWNIRRMHSRRWIIHGLSLERRKYTRRSKRVSSQLTCISCIYSCFICNIVTYEGLHNAFCANEEDMYGGSFEHKLSTDDIILLKHLRCTRVNDLGYKQPLNSLVSHGCCWRWHTLISKSH